MAPVYPRSYHGKCELLEFLLDEFDIDTHLIDSRNAATERKCYANYKCDICQKSWGSAYGWFHVDIKAPAMRRWGQCCKTCWTIERQRNLSGANLTEEKLESLLVKSIYFIINKFHCKLMTQKLHDRYDTIMEKERGRVRSNREPGRPDHDESLCERCQYGHSPYCLGKRNG